MTRTCTGCNAEKDVSEYYTAWNNQRQKRFVRGQCKDCEKKLMSQRHIKRTYGLTLDEYAELTAKGCAICGSLDDLCVDHDHSCCPGRKSCGKCVRGILCSRHNKAEGFLSSADEAYALAEYMKEWAK